MRGIDAAHAELLKADPACALTKTALRRLVVTGEIPSVRVGTKYLIDLDRLELYLSNPPDTGEDLYQYRPGKIRRVSA